MKALIGLIACAGSLAGCAGQQEMRTLAADSATVMNDYRRQLNAFAEQQTALNADTQRRIRYFGDSREMSETYVNQRLLALKVAGEKSTLEAYELLTSPSAAEIIAQSSLLTPPAAPAAAPAVKFDPASVEKLTRQLNALRRPPSYWDRIRATVAYGEGLRKAYEKSLGDAEDNAATAVVDGKLLETNIEVPALPEREER